MKPMLWVTVKPIKKYQNICIGHKYLRQYQGECIKKCHDALSKFFSTELEAIKDSMKERLTAILRLAVDTCSQFTHLSFLPKLHDIFADKFSMIVESKI